MTFPSVRCCEYVPVLGKKAIDLRLGTAIFGYTNYLWLERWHPSPNSSAPLNASKVVVLFPTDPAHFCLAIIEPLSVVIYLVLIE